jgi:CRISPR-associated protein Cas5d
MPDPPLAIKVWGRMACFTRPENKVERVSYPVMTPSAARGILEAIFWKPEFAYRVREIAVLTPIRYVSIVRNEVTLKAGRGMDGILADDPSVRAQRHTLALCGEGGNDLAYVIRADAIVKPGVNEESAKYRDQFRRRVDRGQCYHRPALGCREWACDFAPLRGDEKPIQQSANLGLMLFDIAFGSTPDGPNIPLFFDAKLENGVLRVPDDLYNKLEAIRL